MRGKIINDKTRSSLRILDFFIVCFIYVRSDIIASRIAGLAFGIDHRFVREFGWIGCYEATTDFFGSLVSHRFG
jgi:hypothetical protein